MDFEHLKDRKLGEVMTEEQYNSLRETIFLSVLEGILSDNQSDYRKISVPEHRQLLKEIFGMHDSDIDSRIEGFLHHQSNDK